MNKFILSVLVVISTQLKAQIEITQSHMPSINDTIRYSISNNNSLDFKISGSDYFWNFKNLNITGQDIYKFQALINTPYAALAFTGMPLGAIGYKIADSIGQGQTSVKNLYNFFEKKSTGWNAVGTGFTLSALPFPAGGVYSDKDEIYKFPLKYNDSDSSTFRVTTSLYLQLGSLMQKGYRLTKVEGWGLISTPYGDSIKCLKVKSIIVETDSLKISTLSLNVGFQVRRVEYRWLSTSEKIPVLEVSGTEIGGVFTPATIRYRDNYRVPGPNPLIPRAKFTVDKTVGVIKKDTFSFTNLSTPSLGATYDWTITPALGINYVSSSNSNSKDPMLVFDSTGLYTVSLKVTNLAGTNDTTAFDLISISKENTQNINSKTVQIQNVYPNPVVDKMHFLNSEFEGKICRIFDASGRLVLETPISNDLSISCQMIPTGIYTLLILDSNMIYYTQITKN